ncbi:uncharacterized protein LOC108094790 [Drosophila ficusphila]|uniref:uncharacterized protein LOC108094790 n=1 Tax=Drosophila ficusphila TaxID=30025 RepID=UPI0007E7C4B6|nr:uncharacterized protein LOC108094790 [Drosophila ficusphila]
MCMQISKKYACITLGGIAIILSAVELSYNAYEIVTMGLNDWLLAAVVAWIPISFAAVLLIIGAIFKIKFLLLLWSLVALVFGIGLVVIKTGLLILVYDSAAPEESLLIATLNIIFLLLVFIFVYYPYAYVRELQEEQNNFDN